MWHKTVSETSWKRKRSTPTGNGSFLYFFKDGNLLQLIIWRDCQILQRAEVLALVDFHRVFLKCQTCSSFRKTSKQLDGFYSNSDRYNRMYVSSCKSPQLKMAATEDQLWRTKKRLHLSQLKNDDLVW